MSRQGRALVCVAVGDVIEAKFDHRSVSDSKRTVVGIVIECKKRYGRVNNGRHRLGRLVTIKSNEGLRDSFDESFVTQVIERYKGPAPQKYNGHREICPPERWDTHNVGRGLWRGLIADIATMCLAKIPAEFVHQVSREKCTVLYDRQEAGLVARESDYRSFVTVHRKQFSRWVEQNKYRICDTSKEKGERETAFHTTVEESYWRSVEEEWYEEEEFDRRYDDDSRDDDPEDYP